VTRSRLLVVVPALLLTGCGADPGTGRVPAESVFLHTMTVLGVFFGGVIAVVGVGCAAAVLGAAFPAVARANDRAARERGTTGPLLVGALVVLGTLVALSGASKAGEGATWAAALLLALPASLLWLAGLTAVLPLIGERCLGAGGAVASPLRRAVVASLAIGVAAVPTAATKFVPLWALLGLVVFGWPTGVGLLAAIARWKSRSPRAEPPPPPAPPTP
jgi:hypothetical protein